MILPPPSPWNARAVISQVIFLAAPHKADAMKKMTIAEYTIGLRPMISETLPFNGFITVAASRYAYMFSLVEAVFHSLFRPKSTPRAWRGVL